MFLKVPVEVIGRDLLGAGTKRVRLSLLVGSLNEGGCASSIKSGFRARSELVSLIAPYTSRAKVKIFL